MSYGFSYGSPRSLAGLTHALEGDAFFVIRLWGLYLRWGGVVVVIIIHLEWGYLRHQVLVLGGAIH
jgi:hypothetical protein